MTAEQHTLTDVSNWDAWPANEDPRDTWAGVEIASAPDYNALTHTIVGGFFSVHGAEPGTVVVLDDTGTKLEAFSMGDPGYHVHFTQAPGSGPFTLSISLVYSVEV